VWRFGYVDGLRVKVRPDWKRQIAQQVSAVSEQCALVIGGIVLVNSTEIVLRQNFLLIRLIVSLVSNNASAAP